MKRAPRRISSHRPGVLLSGHSDVVPAEGQDWSSDPFKLTARNGALYGRGVADMKGFVACALRVAKRAAGRELKTPLWIALSHDEEIGCVGVRRLIDRMEKDGLRPRMCIVGEPTSMEVATGHKGKLSLRACCSGRSEHSAFAPETVDALHLACDFVGALREEQAALASGGPFDRAYRVPCTTIHASRITGGTAPNIVPSRCDVDFEIRYISSDDPEAIVGALAARGGASHPGTARSPPRPSSKSRSLAATPGWRRPSTRMKCAWRSRWRRAGAQPRWRSERRPECSQAGLDAPRSFAGPARWSRATRRTNTSHEARWRNATRCWTGFWPASNQACSTAEAPSAALSRSSACSSCHMWA